MAENGAPPTKRPRYNLRGISAETSRRQPNRYMLRSIAREIPVEHVELVEPKRKKHKKLLTLNSDCLLKIFEHMKLNDVCNVAQTCTSLYNLAKYHFRLRYKHLDFAQLIDEGALLTDDVKTLLRIFGDQIRSLNISRDLFTDAENAVSSKLLLLVNQYCRHIVKDLTLDGFDIDPNVIGSISSLFDGLESLSFTDCYMYDVNWCPSNNLKVLKLNAIGASWLEWWSTDLSKLEELYLNDLDIFEDSLNNLLNSTRVLKRCSIVKCYDISTEIFRCLPAMKDLEDFEFQMNLRTHNEERFRRNLMHLSSIKKLKSLKLNCNRMSVLPLLQQFVQDGIGIEYLELADGIFDGDTAICIGQLKAVKVLRLNNMINFVESHISPMTKKLHLLEEFHLKTDSKISQFRIKEILRESSSLTSLKVDVLNFTLHVDTYKFILSIVKSRIERKQLQASVDIFK